MSLPTEYQSYIHTSRYARWLPDENRRETWEETVTRYVNFMYKHVKNNTTVSEEDSEELYKMLGATCEK